MSFTLTKNDLSLSNHNPVNELLFLTETLK